MTVRFITVIHIIIVKYLLSERLPRYERVLLQDTFEETDYAFHYNKHFNN